jgi:hypothetical protein
MEQLGAECVLKKRKPEENLKERECKRYVRLSEDRGERRIKSWICVCFSGFRRWSVESFVFSNNG